MTHRMIRRSAQASAAVLALLLLSTQLGFSASVQRQSCSGILAHDDDGYLLQPDAGTKSPWCPAYIGDDDKSALAKRVLKTCALGGHCHIEGSFAGHGIFYWTKISSVSLLK
jgi:hypothetical protein